MFRKCCVAFVVVWIVTRVVSGGYTIVTPGANEIFYDNSTIATNGMANANTVITIRLRRKHGQNWVNAATKTRYTDPLDGQWDWDFTPPYDPDVEGYLWLTGKYQIDVTNSDPGTPVPIEIIYYDDDM